MKEHISLPGAVIMEDILREDLQLLNNEYINTNKYIEIYPYNKNIAINLGDHDSVREDDHCINLYVRSNTIHNNDIDPKSATVQHAMLVWLYMIERQLPYSIIAVEVSYSSWSQSSLEFVILSRYEFEMCIRIFPR
ncbi:MAG: hypothetical protein WD424_05910 [Paenibacillaceae bacterium]